MQEVQRLKLPNGLTVLLKPDRRAPVACLLTWVNAGYLSEPDESLGISHFLEHMLFKGTPTRGRGVIAQETKSIGGYLNAATIYDYTYYYTVVPAQHLGHAIELQSDAMIHSLFDEEEIEREKQVVIQELKRKYDNPNPYAWEKLIATAFNQHRIRRWRMGHKENIQGYTRKVLLEFYQSFYRPSNMAVIATGDFDPDAIFLQIEQCYGKMREDSPCPPTVITEDKQSGARLMRLTGDIARALVKMGFHAPSRMHQDYYAMTFLSTLLGRGRSSRLYRSLREEKETVDAVMASFYSTKEVGYFTIEAELKPEKTATFEEEVWIELDRIRRDPPTALEIDKIRNVIATNFFGEQEDVLGQAYNLAYFESLGGYELAREDVDRMRSVTPAELVKVSQEYLTFSNMSLLEYVPNEVGLGAPFEQRIESLRRRVVASVERAGPPGAIAEVSLPSSLGGNGNLKTEAKTAETILMKNGITLLHIYDPTLPLVSVCAHFPGGRLDETSGNCGITQFVLRNTLKGTENRTADEIAFEVESLGTSIRCEATADLFGYSLNLLATNLDKGMELLSDILVRPTFAQREIERERTSTLAKLRQMRDDMFHYPIELFYSSLYGLHPYGLPRNGTEESITQIDRDQLLDWYSETFRWRKMVIAIVGDCERSHALDLVQRYFDVAKDQEDERRAQIFAVIPDCGPRERVESRDRNQTGIAIGFPGLSLKDERFFALEVLRNLLSGMGGRMFTELRDKRGLVYTVASFNIGLMRGGAFFTYLATSPEREQEARDALFRLLKQAQRERCRPEELNAAKAFSQGSYAIGMQGNMGRAYEHLHQLMAGRGLEAVAEYSQRIEAVTADQVRQIAEEVFQYDRHAVGIVRGKNG